MKTLSNKNIIKARKQAIDDIVGIITEFDSEKERRQLIRRIALNTLIKIVSNETSNKLSNQNPVHASIANCGGVFNKTNEKGLIVCNRCGETLPNWCDELTTIM